MKLVRLKAFIVGLSVAELGDLKQFLKYRKVAECLPGKLLDILSNEDTEATKAAICAKLLITDGSFRTAKSKLNSIMMCWWTLNANGRHAALLVKLTEAFILVDLGECKKAFELMNALHQQAEQEGQILMAILVCKLQISLLPLLKTSLPADTDLSLQAELARLKRVQQTLTKTEALLAEIMAVQYATCLSREPESQQQVDALALKLTRLSRTSYTVAPYIYAQFIYCKAGFLEMQGSENEAYLLMRQHWNGVNDSTNNVPLGDYRYQHYFFRLMKLAIKQNDWETALEVNLLHQTAISRYHGNLPEANALNRFLAHLIHLISQDATEKEVTEFYQTVQLTMKAHACHNLQLDFRQWDAHVCASILAISIATCFEHKHYNICNRLLGLVQQLNTSNSGVALELQCISRLISLTVLVQIEQENATCKNLGSNRNFEHNVKYCYDYFRKRKGVYPIEWELARLFNGIHTDRKTKEKLFTETYHNLLQLAFTARYYNSFMQLFNFHGWVERQLPVMA